MNDSKDELDIYFKIQNIRLDEYCIIVILDLAWFGEYYKMPAEFHPDTFEVKVDELLKDVLDFEKDEDDLVIDINNWFANKENYSAIHDFVENKLFE